MSQDPNVALLGLSADAGPIRRAVALLDRHGQDLATAIRRAVPFIARRGIPVIPTAARGTSLPELTREHASPTFVAHLATDPGGQRAVLLLDAGAVGFLLEGVLGGDGGSPPALDPDGLTAPQRALVSRIADGLLKSISGALGAGPGFRLVRLPATAGNGPPDGKLVALSLDLGTEGRRRVTIAVAKDALLAAVGAAPARKNESIDPRVAATLAEAPLELRAELGRIKLPLGHVTALRVGDTLRLDAPVDGIVQVRTRDRVLIEGRPTTASGQLAIRVVAVR